MNGKPSAISRGEEADLHIDKGHALTINPTKDAPRSKQSIPLATVKHLKPWPGVH